MIWAVRPHNFAVRGVALPSVRLSYRTACTLMYVYRSTILHEHSHNCSGFCFQSSSSTSHSQHSSH
jgi:hypothetical protein